jgi:hypothetical protein
MPKKDVVYGCAKSGLFCRVSLFQRLPGPGGNYMDGWWDFSTLDEFPNGSWDIGWIKKPNL